VEAYSCGSEAMKIYSGHERANMFVAKIRDIVCEFLAQCVSLQIICFIITTTKSTRNYKKKNFALTSNIWLTHVIF